MYASARKYAYKWWLPILSSRRRRLLKNGELYIKHSYEGIELDLKYLEKYYHIFINYGEERCIWSPLWRVRALCFLMMVRWCIGSMWRGRTDIGYCVRSFIWNQVKYAILEKRELYREME